MKKLLLLLSVTVVAAGSALATATEDLIFTYDYTSWKSYDPTPCTYIGSTQAPYDWADNMSNYWSSDTGFTAVNGGQLGTDGVTDASTIASSAVGQAMTLINFGGTIGTVLCFNGGSSGLQTYLNQNYDTAFGTTYTTQDDDDNEVTVTVQSITSGSPGGWLNFFWSYPAVGNHRVAQDGSAKWIRAKIYLNVFSSEPSSTSSVFSGIDFYSNGSITSGGATDVYSSNFADENGAWYPNYWMTYTTDGYAGEGGSYNMGLRIKFAAGTLSSYAIFIRKIELYYVTGDSSDYLSTATTDIDTENYEYQFTSTDPNGQTTGITSVASDEAAGYSVNGQEVTFDSAATIYSISGSAVAVAKAGETKTLSKGFYVARVGNKGIKFAVK